MLERTVELVVRDETAIDHRLAEAGHRVALRGKSHGRREVTGRGVAVGVDVRVVGSRPRGVGLDRLENLLEPRLDLRPVGAGGHTVLRPLRHYVGSLF